jgi:DNA-binding response OmpR family regulator
MEKRARILYVEDDPTLSFVTCDNLEQKGYRVDHIGDGQAALEQIKQKRYDVCILDVMLPKMDGFTLAHHIRESDPDVPILFLTARSAKEDRIHGLRLGADDYITKPFSIEELVLKIEVFLKRSRINPDRERKIETIRLGTLVFDPSNLILHQGTTRHSLTHREAALLTLFTRHSNKVIKREEILMEVWGNDHFFNSRSLDVFISRLRKLLKSDPTVILENIHNVGYRLNIPSSEFPEL